LLEEFLAYGDRLARDGLSKSVFEFRGRHEVLDADGAVIGMLEKDFSQSLLCSH
jgi:hypothetical protein